MIENEQGIVECALVRLTGGYLWGSRVSVKNRPSSSVGIEVMVPIPRPVLFLKRISASPSHTMPSRRAATLIDICSKTETRKHKMATHRVRNTQSERYLDHERHATGASRKLFKTIYIIHTYQAKVHLRAVYMVPPGKAMGHTKRC